MKKITLALALALAALTFNLSAQDAGGPPPDGPKGGGPGDGKPGFHVHVLPPRAGEALNLTDDQKKQIADLEAQTQAALEKILTPGQLQQLQQMHPPHRPGGPDGGPGGSGGPAGDHDGKPSDKTSGSAASQ